MTLWPSDVVARVRALVACVLYVSTDRPEPSTVVRGSYVSAQGLAKFWPMASKTLRGRKLCAVEWTPQSFEFLHLHFLETWSFYGRPFIFRAAFAPLSRAFAPPSRRLRPRVRASPSSRLRASHSRRLRAAFMPPSRRCEGLPPPSPRAPPHGPSPFTIPGAAVATTRSYGPLPRNLHRPVATAVATALFPRSLHGPVATGGSVATVLRQCRSYGATEIACP